MVTLLDGCDWLKVVAINGVTGPVLTYSMYGNMITKESDLKVEDISTMVILILIK